MELNLNDLLTALEQPEVRTMAIIQINAIEKTAQLEQELKEAREVGNLLNAENTKNMETIKELSEDNAALRAFITENIKDEALLSQILN